jgi:hypothetical protein
MNIQGISSLPGLDRMTARKYVQPANVEELLSPAAPNRRTLTLWTTYVNHYFSPAKPCDVTPTEGRSSGPRIGSQARARAALKRAMPPYNSRMYGRRMNRSVE